MKDLVVITGGNSGLGRELVKKFSENGYEVLSISRTKRAEANGVHYEYGNIADEAFIKNLYKKYEKNYKIKYLINNAGLGIFGLPEINTAEAIDKVLDSNLKGMILNTTYALPLIKDAEGNRYIVNIMSTAALKGLPSESLYCAAKWGAKGYTESLKVIYKGTNIRVIGVYPGGINTEFWDNNHDYAPVEKCNKFMNPKDVANVIFNNITSNGLVVENIVIEKL